MPDHRAANFLSMIRRAQRGRLKVYLGFAPGVGKTYLMLQEGHRLKAEGIDVVIGRVEHHGRSDTQRLIEGLAQVPLRKVEYRGISVEEMDLDAILTRKPQVCLVDELAHTNIPGSRNSKRYQDVQDLQAAGIHVISTLNVQHLESLYDTVERLIGVKVRERIPDAVIADADEVVNVDLAAEDLQKRLRDGKIYPQERIATSLENFFTGSNLEHLRELTLRELASQLDFRRRETKSGNGAADVADHDLSAASDQIMVCLSSRGPNSARLLRFGSRLAGRLNRNWYAVYVQTPREEPTVIDSVTQRLLTDTLTLANQLGATVFTFKGADIPDTILRFAREYRVGQIVIGSPHAISWWKRALLGHRSVAEELITRQKGTTVIVVDADAADDTSAVQQPAFAQSGEPSGTSTRSNLTSIVQQKNVLLIPEPLTHRQLLECLVSAALVGRTDAVDKNTVLQLIEQRESRGSTVLNEGIALPHARVPGLSAPAAALAVIPNGLLDAPGDAKVEMAFLLLTPEANAATHLSLLAAAGRLLGERDRRRRLLGAASTEEIVSSLQ